MATIKIMLKITPKNSSQLRKILQDPQIPGSKYEAVRLLFLAALAKGTTTLQGLPAAQDIVDAIAALQDLGIEITSNQDTATIKGSCGKFTPIKSEVYLGKSGTLARFIIPFIALQSKAIRVNADPQLCSRPMQEIFCALTEQGVQISSCDGHLPATVQGGNLQNKKIYVDASRSSQFLSGLLIIAPTAGLQISTSEKVVSRSFVNLTLDLMKKFSATWHKPDSDSYQFTTSGYQARESQIPADWSSASYFLALAAITATPCTLANLDLHSRQGEAEFYRILQKMGCPIEENKDALCVESCHELQGISADLNLMPDIVPTLAVIATLAKSKTVISNIEHLRYKECDRLSLMVQEINNIGGKAEALADKMIIYPQKPTGGIIDPHDDHRLAMSFALLGLAGIPLQIKNPHCVNKSFPNFWQIMGVQT